MTQFTTRDVPWSKIGVTFDEVDRPLTAAEAIEKAGLGWHVELRKDGFQTASGTWRVDQSKRKVVRTDTETPLGTVSPNYEILNFDEAFEFMDTISPEFVAAGGLKHDKQAFVVVKAPNHDLLAALAGDDPHQLYVVLRASHDGSRAVEVNIMPLRDECMNMMPLASFGKAAPQRWSIRHTKNMRTKLEQARNVITGLDKYAEEYKATAERLAAIDVDMDEARRVIADVLPDHLKRPDTQIDAIAGLFENSSFNSYKGTGWGLVNAVTEHFDWYRGGENREAVTRWVQGLDGTTTKAVNKTVELLTR